jgi:hypothetical protein
LPKKSGLILGLKFMQPLIGPRLVDIVALRNLDVVGKTLYIGRKLRTEDFINKATASRFIIPIIAIKKFYHLAEVYPYILVIRQPSPLVT